MAYPERITQFCGIITRFTLQVSGQTNLNCWSRKCTGIQLAGIHKKTRLWENGL